MSDCYHLACSKCKVAIWIGQSSTSSTWCFYTGEQYTMNLMKQFLYEHMGHPLVFDDSQILEYQDFLPRDNG